MTFANYIALVGQFFFKKSHTFWFRLGSVKVSAIVTSGPDAVNQAPAMISLGQAIQIVGILSGAPLADSLTEKFVLDGITVSVTISKI